MIYNLLPLSGGQILLNLYGEWGYYQVPGSSPQAVPQAKGMGGPGYLCGQKVWAAPDLSSELEQAEGRE